MTNRLPTRVEVGPLVYTVRTAEITDFGGCDHDQTRINVRRGMSRATTSEVLFHEIGHAVAELVGLGLTDKQEERVMKVLMPALLDTLRRNPKLRDYLFN